MDLLSQHEAFLRAIFDAPDDDTPRLVYADFLQEHGEEGRAEFIRLQCEVARLPSATAVSDETERRIKLLARQAGLVPRNRSPGNWRRGFQHVGHVAFDGEQLHDVTQFRRTIVAEHPHWFMASALCVFSNSPLDPARIDALLEMKAFARVTWLDLRGNHTEEENSQGDGVLSVYVTRPTIGFPGVAALAAHKAARRLTTLLLTNNELDNDAARALVKSPYLDNLKQLQLLEGNRFRGRVWQQVIERFGEDVVG